ncbi:uncharacterized protein J3R85_016121 [Psidium guajava]|nr:uncharacterized protein J3R85_016121 [Psidium guajava]
MSDLLSYVTFHALATVTATANDNRQSNRKRYLPSIFSSNNTLPAKGRIRKARAANSKQYSLTH